MDNHKQKNRIPLIERITICGIRINDIRNFLNDPSNEIKKLKTLKVKILEDYKSNLIPDTKEYNAYTTNIPNVYNNVTISFLFLKVLRSTLSMTHTKTLPIRFFHFLL